MSYCSKVKTLWLIDGSSLAYRGFFAFIKNPLRNSKGENTSAIFGFLNSLLKLLNDKKPEYLLICFDTPAPTFRHKLFETYKATRPKAPNELLPQLSIIKQIVKCFGIQVLEIEGIEADDDLLALTGDSIDNIPGVPGIGPKTAVDLITAFGGVEDILANAHKIGNERIREAIINFADQLLLSKALATIDTNVEIKIIPEDLKITAMDETSLVMILKEQGFFSIIKKLNLAGKFDFVGTKKYTIGNLEDISLTHETSIVFAEGDLTSQYFSLSCQEGKAEVFSLNEQYINKIMQDLSIKKITPDAKALFTKYDVQGEVFDLGIASYLLKPEIKEHSLDNIAVEWLSYPLSDFQPEADKPPAQKPETLINGLGERADVSYRLYKILEPKLKSADLDKLFNEVELPLARVLADMERRGVLIDRDYFSLEAMKIDAKLLDIERDIYVCAGVKFNIRSPAQMSEVLFTRLKLPHSRKTKTHFSTDQSVLHELAKEYELPKKILVYRELFKLKSTYLDAIPLLADNENRVHTTWQQTTTATGRLSSANPNLQNIPKQEIRKGFIAPNGWHILSADYSQIELRVLAALSGDMELIDAFKQGKDIHTRTAAVILNIPEDRVTKEEREQAKVVNFGIVYGMGPYGLSQRLGIGVEEANLFITAYFITYPGVKRWIDEQIRLAQQNGYCETLIGRKRWVQGINSDNMRIREAEERIVMNTPIQGTAADMIKIAMIKINERLKDLKSRIIIQVHDELVL
ncbi:MAG: hypothetical protein HY769_06980, partial [Candidatus Stahlbacteria bacterium]|nr:hypothetical protein [Candidatus Stahlbacteria bacterium]